MEELNASEESPRLDFDEDHDNPRPVNVRAGSECFLVTTGAFEVRLIRRVDWSLDLVIQEEIEDFQAGLRWHEKQGTNPADEDDLAIWSGNRLVALVRPVNGEEPEILRPEDWTRDLFAWERYVLRLARELGEDLAPLALDAALREVKGGAR